MELALVLRELRARRLLVAIGLIVAAIAAVLSAYQVSGTSLKPKGLTFSSASTQAFIDTPGTALGNVTQDVTQLQTRATVLANFMASPTIVDLIGKQVGLTGGQIYAAGPVNANQPRSVIEPTALKRNVQVTGETAPYRLEFLNDPTLPIIGVNTQAPTTKMAIALANASVVALQQYVNTLEITGRTPSPLRITIRPLGQAIGGPVNSGVSKKLAAMVFIAVFVLWCVLVLVGTRFRQSWKASATVYDELATAKRLPVPVSSNGDGSSEEREAAIAASVERPASSADEQLPAPTSLTRSGRGLLRTGQGLVRSTEGLASSGKGPS